MQGKVLSPKNISSLEMKKVINGFLAGFWGNGEKFVITGGGRTVSIWDGRGVKMEQEIVLSPVQAGALSAASRLFFREGEILTLGKGREGLGVVRWNLRRGGDVDYIPMRGDFKVDEQFYIAASLSESGSLLASASGKTPYVVDISTGEVRRFKSFFGGHGDWVISTCFSTNDALLATLGWDGKVKVWDVERGKLRATLDASRRGEKISLGYLLWFRGTTLAVSVVREAEGGEKHSIATIWEVKRGKTLFSLDNLVRLVPPAEMGLGARLLVGAFVAWQYGERHKDLVTSVDLSPKRDLVATASYDCTVKIWHLRGRRADLLRTLEFDDPCVRVAFSPGGEMLFVTVCREKEEKESKSSSHGLGTNTLYKEGVFQRLRGGFSRRGVLSGERYEFTTFVGWT